VTRVFVVAWGESRTTTQSALEREVGRLVTGQPLIFTELAPQAVGALALTMASSCSGLLRLGLVRMSSQQPSVPST
jgi:hypothetical protein